MNITYILINILRFTILNDKIDKIYDYLRLIDMLNDNTSISWVIKYICFDG